jgi:hypothetical protein
LCECFARNFVVVVVVVFFRERPARLLLNASFVRAMRLTSERSRARERRRTPFELLSDPTTT